MMGTQRESPRRPIAVGPGDGTVAEAGGGGPRFADDPVSWLDWLDRALSDGRPLEDAARPGVWVDARGCAWRVLVAPEGPEVRPVFGSAFVLARDLPLISAMLITPDRIHVELTWREGHEAVAVDPAEVSVRRLGLAMLTATELPHEAIGRVGPDTWRRAMDRWPEIAGSTQARR